MVAMPILATRFFFLWLFAIAFICGSAKGAHREVAGQKIRPAMAEKLLLLYGMVFSSY